MYSIWPKSLQSYLQFPTRSSPISSSVQLFEEEPGRVIYDHKNFNSASKITDPVEASSMTGEESALPAAITMKWWETSKSFKCLAIIIETVIDYLLWTMYSILCHTFTMHMI